jgi:hypothetical protein
VATRRRPGIPSGFRSLWPEKLTGKRVVTRAKALEAFGREGFEVALAVVHAPVAEDSPDHPHGGACRGARPEELLGRGARPQLLDPGFSDALPRDGAYFDGAYIQVDLDELIQGAGLNIRQRRLLRQSGETVSPNGDMVKITWRGLRPPRDQFLNEVCRLAPGAFVAYRPATIDELKEDGQVSSERWTGRTFEAEDRLMARPSGDYDPSDWRQIDRSELV